MSAIFGCTTCGEKLNNCNCEQAFRRKKRCPDCFTLFDSEYDLFEHRITECKPNRSISIVKVASGSASTSKPNKARPTTTTPTPTDSTTLGCRSNDIEFKVITTKCIICDDCGQEFHSNWNLKRHKQNSCKWVHPIPVGKPDDDDDENDTRPKIKCDKCGASFGSNYNLRRHQRSSCTGALADDDERRLILQQRATKRYACLECKKKFSNRNSLRNHKLLYCRSAKPRIVKNRLKILKKCNDCGAALFSTFNLNRHQRDNCPAKKPAQSAIACDICSLNFSTQQELDDHSQTHANETS